MVFGKVRGLLKRALTVTLTAAMIATSAPGFSVTAAEPETRSEQQSAGSVVSETEAEKTESEAAQTGSEENGTEAASESIETEESSSPEKVTEEENGAEAAADKIETESVIESETVSKTEAETETEEEVVPEIVSDGADGEADTKNMSLRFVVSAVEASDNGWKNLIQEDVTADFTSITELKSDYTLSYDLYLPSDADFMGSFYIKTVTKLQDSTNTWVWTDGNESDAKNVAKTDFTEDADNAGLLKYTYSGKIGTGAEAYTGIDALVVAVGSSDSTYNGAIFVDNVKLSNAEGNVLVQQDFTGYTNAVELGNMDGVDSGEGGDTKEASKVIFEQDFDALVDITALGNGNLGTAGVTPELAEIVNGNKALKYTVDLSTSTGWKDAIQAEIQLSEPYTEAITDKVNMSFDVYVPDNNLDNFGTMKAQAALKSGDSWTWVTQKSWPQFTAETLETDENVSGYKKMHFSIDMNDFQTWDSAAGSNVDYKFEDITPIQAIIPCLAGDTSTYAGDLYLDNIVVTAYNQTAGEEPPVVVEGDVNLSLDASAWSTAAADYEYSGTKTVNNVTINEKQMLALSVDYTANASAGWSEAKLDYTHPAEVASMNGYNMIKADVYYKPDNKSKGSFQIKVFCDSLGIDKNAAVPEGTPVENVAGLEGYYKAEFELAFKTADKAFQNLTLGIVGQNTDYKGDIIFDNIRFTQYIAPDADVDSTVAVQKGNGITVAADGRSLTTASGKTTAIPSEVALVDANASEATKNLYAYLEAVGKSDSVIFGHQNDTHHKTGATGEDFTNSDVKDITGSISGVVGIDTLSLTGNEAGTWDMSYAERIALVAGITKEAAAEGAIITLSAHMPNFDVIDKKVKAFEAGGKTGTTSDTLGYWENADGTKTYNFSGYTPNTLTGDVVERIMPGQDLNYLFTAYLDMIADYAKAVENDGITILFRPFHENTGSWFWWGAAFCDETAYINLYRYTVDYLKETKGVHNILYVYGPGSEAENVESYAARYPGDAYVDMIGYDLYHSKPTQENEAAYLANIKAQNTILRTFAAEHHKLYAITETGVANDDGAALLRSGNEVKDWYMQLLNAVSEDKEAGGADGGVSYFLVWANFGENSGYYTPFVTEKKADGVLHGHEMLDDFIRFYNDGRSVFATDMNRGYAQVKGVTNTTKADTVSGYITAPLAGSRILAETTLQAKISGVTAETKVYFELSTEFDADTKITLEAAYKEGTGLWEAVLSEAELKRLAAGLGSIVLFVNGQETAKTNVLFNMPEEEANPLVPDDFESYGGSNKLLNSAWATNKATGSSIQFNLTREEGKVFGGNYGLEMDITLDTANDWAGATKSMNSADWSSANALEFYTIPEKNGQKVVVQVTSDNKVFEVYMQESAAYVEAGKNKTPVKVTIPFASFAGRDSKADVFNPAKIDSIGLWCNALEAEGVTFPLKTAIVYDEIKVVTTDKTEITVEKYEKPAEPEPEPEPKPEPEPEPKPEPREGIWIEELEEQVYTGKALKPEVKVYDGEDLLVKNKDYTVSYLNNVNAGTATAKIKGKGNYSETLTKDFTIAPKDLSEITVTAAENIAWTNKEQTVKVTVKDGKKALKLGRDYTLSLNNESVTAVKVKDEGAYTVKIQKGTGGNYTGEAAVTFNVTKKTLLYKAKVVLPSGSLDYADGKAAEFDASKVKVKLGGKEIPQKAEDGTENYTISYENNVEVGKEAYIVITAGKDSDYAGSVKKKFAVKGTAFGTKTVLIENFAVQADYTGTAIEQKALVLYDKAQYNAAVTEEEKLAAKLTEDEDYTLVYKNHQNAGKATLTITGKGKYTGKITKTYSIKKIALTEEMLAAKTVTAVQNKAGAAPDAELSYNGMKLENGKDYKLTYTNNKNITSNTNKAYITISGKGNYSGTLRKAVELVIVPKSLQSEEITVTVPDMKYSARAKEYKPTPVVCDNGKKLKKGTDYTIAYENNQAEAVGEIGKDGKTEHTATVVITAVKGSSYYVTAENEAAEAEANTRTLTFRITGKMIKDAKVEVINAMSFKKEGVVPAKTDLKITYKGDTVREEEYDIVSCTKNEKKGTAVMVIQGKGQYGGTKSVKFKIGARGMETFKEQIADTMNSIMRIFGF